MEITKEYARAYVEVLEVIKYLKKEEYEKIPKEKIELYETYKDVTYKFKYDSKKSLDSQVSFETKNVLANLFLKYISTQDDRNEFYKKERKEWYENETSKTYDTVNPLFKEKKVVLKNKEMIVVTEEKESFFIKIIKKIKMILRR